LIFIKREILRKKILIGGPVRRKPAILAQFLESLASLNLNDLEINFLFIDDNNDPQSKSLLKNFCCQDSQAEIIEEQAKDEYDEEKHTWSPNLVQKIIVYKNRIIENALALGYDYLFLADSDLVIHPETLLHLVSLEKDIVSEVYWTRWDAKGDYLPQVWLSDFYSFENVPGPGFGKRESPLQFLDKLKEKGTYEVGGLGACTLLSRAALAKGVNFDFIDNLPFEGEDRFFCVRAAVLGLKMFADTFYPPLHIYRENDLLKVQLYKQSWQKINEKNFTPFLLDLLKNSETPANKSPEKIISPVNLAWDGSQFINHSLAIVNREIGLELVKRPEILLSVIPYQVHYFTEKDQPRFTPLAAAFFRKLENKEFTVRHRWPPDFTPPDQGKFIIMQPWEMGDMPAHWYNPLIFSVDEIWVYSQANKNIYLNSGIPDEKIFIVPLGLRKELYEKEYQPYFLNTKAKYKFFFNGGTVFRKGVDILLKAFIQEFSPGEDVCLVIKDVGLNIYPDNYQENIEAAVNNASCPEIIYIREDMHEDSLMQLYKACDCYVHPYRGEGFGLPIAEAMGHGLPVIMTGYGSATDFCKPEFSYYLDYDLVKLVEEEKDKEQIEHSLPFPEVRVGSLRYWLRHVYENREEAGKKGLAAKNYILENFTWEKTAALITEHLLEIRHLQVFRENLNFYFEHYFKKGISYFNNAEYESASRYFSFAANLNGNSPENNYYRGLAFLKLGRSETALDYLRRSYQLGYKDREVFQNIAFCLESLGDHKTAEIFRNKYNNPG
jgi:glycosyltransferase involved in cell wall biosynthesis